MCGRESIGGWENVFGDGIENGGVVSEQADVKDLLRITKAEMLKLSVEAGIFGPEVWDPKTRRDLKTQSEPPLVIPEASYPCAGNHYDVSRPLQQ